MPKVSERERIQALEEKLKQLKVVQQRKEARARSVEGRRTRREELRRKFLVGAVVLAKVDDGSLEEKTLKIWLDPAIARAEDRVLFDLPPRA
jgi:polynucleotide 5'-kinase involved in rRNA processing